MEVDDRASTGTDATSVGAAEGDSAGSDVDSGQETEATPAEESAPPALPLDQVFEIAKNERRRNALRYLRSHEAPVKLGTLAEHIAAVENDTTVKAISSQQRKRVYVGLYQCHLPKMDDMHIVEFNQNRGLIELGPNAEQLYPYIDDEDEQETRWPQVYLGLSAAGGLLLLASLTVGSTVGLTPALAAAVSIAAVGATSAVHARS